MRRKRRDSLKELFSFKKKIFLDQVEDGITIRNTKVLAKRYLKRFYYLNSLL